MMMIWKHLPCELIREIVILSDPSIDTRLYFRLPPKKLDEEYLLRFEWRLYGAHDGIVYNTKSKSLHIFRVLGCHVIHRPVELDVMDEWLAIFNQAGEEHTIVTTTTDGINLTQSDATFYTELRVLLVD
jgi:hypothetical protein